MEKINTDDEIPDLEDFSYELNKINEAKGVNTSKSVPIKIEVKEDINKTNSTNISNKTNNDQTTNYEFGMGLKKGFLNKASQNSKSNTTTTTNNNKKDEHVTDLTNVKAKKNTLEIQEVQNNMKNSSETNNSKFLVENIIGKKDQWLNQELLMKLASNPRLLKAFTHPSFNDAMTLLQKDPAEAKRKFGDNADFNEFFKEFSALMADHFKNMGEKETNKFINEKSSDPEVEKILKDPKVQGVLKRMQIEGKIDSDVISKDNDLLIKIDKLIKKGVLKTIPMK